MRLIALTAAASAFWCATSGAQAAECGVLLEKLRLDDVNLLSAVRVPKAEGLPAYCRVIGYIRPAIFF